MSTKEVLEQLIKEMENLRNNRTVPYLNPYKGIDDCLELTRKKLSKLSI